ncbi:MAG: hypothetical protein JWM25_1704 [Thermoleophilia bacterium]|nr:hypothetical protein [Thermoleophilia bacterium]MCZ4497119.1 hypothetical protein [Thermoleophilia bacterium]
MSETRQPSAWSHLIGEWAAREAQLRPHLPVLADSVRVRDAVEVGDHAYVLLSFDVDSPWPSEEDVSGANTAVIQAERVRQPWHERDSTRAATTWRTTDGQLTVHEHMLGTSRVFSGEVPDADGAIQVHLEGGNALSATVVDGWFLAVGSSSDRIHALEPASGTKLELERVDVGNLLSEPSFARSAGDAMYFSPLDLRSVVPLVRWTRTEEIVVVATCIEQYDEGGMLRLRIDGTRADDDTFVSWPRITLFADGKEISSAVCGEYSLADTISLDLGFRPWLPQGTKTLGVRVEGVRGARGEVAPIELDVQLPDA